MIHNTRVVALIPARGGSKSIPYKNIRGLAGKPLISWSILAAQQTPEIDRVCVSTDDDKIADVARQYGAEILRRPAHLATDTALVIDSIKHHIQELRGQGEKAGIYLLLEPTAPLRLAEDISACVKLLASPDREFDSVATFKTADLNPHRAWRITENKPEPFIPGAVPWLPRQSLPEAYQLNGCVYAFKPDFLLQQERAVLGGRSGAVTMPKDRSIDIDDEFEFQIAEMILKKRMGA